MIRARSTTRAPGRAAVTLAVLAAVALPLLGAAVPATAAGTVAPSPGVPTSPPTDPTDPASPEPSPEPTEEPTQEPTEEPDDTATPLSVVLTSMSPGQVPRRGAISLTGVVANSTRDVWADVNVAPLLSATPITSREELATAAATEPDVAVGERLTDPGTNSAVGDLAPGDSVAFSIRVPVASLGISGDPGVYWIGVHALGTGPEGRDLLADGRARTFIPLVTRAAARRTVPVSVVLPLRERARRASDGSLNGPARWVDLTGPDGRLSRLVDFGASAGSAPVSWMVDPAVLDALEDFGRGNPPLSLGPSRRADAPPEDGQGENGQDEDEQDDEPAGPSGEESGKPEQASPSASPSASAAPQAADAPSEAERDRATGVLQTFLSTARGRDLLTLGYADPDVAALARRRPSLLRRADTLAARRMEARELTGRPVVAPPDGFFDPDLLEELAEDTTLVLPDRGRPTSPVLSRLPTAQELLLTDERAAAGGPAPTAAQDPLALRQRILAESALEAAGSSTPRPVVVAVTDDWNPGPRWRQADFFTGLTAAPWVRLAPLPQTATTTYDGELTYTRAQQAEEIGARNVAATRTLVRTSTVLDHLLANENDVEDRLAGAALQASAYSARQTPRLAAEQVLAIDAATTAEMGRVQVTGTDFVTLSGGAGSLTVTLVNGLQQPITVGLQARADSPRVEVETPDPVRMQAGQRTTLRLQVRSGVGVHDVTLYPVTTEGEETGTPLTFSLRTSQVGQLIWYIIIAGGVLLAVMIGRRIVLRVRNHRWREEAES